MWIVSFSNIVRFSESSGTTAAITAGDALSPQVCWLVGRSGTVLRTTDGERWQTIPSPTDQDLITVEARSATSAIVVAEGGQRYFTADAGKTWTAR